MKQTNNSVFTAFADRIYNTISNPVELIRFTGDALSWTHEFELKNTEHENASDPHFNLICVINEIAIPWLQASSKGKPASIQAIANGLESLNDTFGAENSHDCLGTLYKAYGKDFTSGRPSPEHYTEDFTGMKVMHLICVAMREYEEVAENTRIQSGSKQE
jgi:hypothetical protein